MSHGDQLLLRLFVDFTEALLASEDNESQFPIQWAGVADFIGDSRHSKLQRIRVYLAYVRAFRLAVSTTRARYERRLNSLSAQEMIRCDRAISQCLARMYFVVPLTIIGWDSAEMVRSCSYRAQALLAGFQSPVNGRDSRLPDATAIR